MLGGRTSSAHKEDESRSYSKVIIAIVVDSISSRRHAGRHVTNAVDSVHNDTAVVIVIITGPHHTESACPAAAVVTGTS